MVNIPFLGALAGCSARRSERRVASHTSEEQRRNALARAAKNGILAFSASLSTQQEVKSQKGRCIEAVSRSSRRYVLPFDGTQYVLPVGLR